MKWICIDGVLSGLVSYVANKTDQFLRSWMSRCFSTAALMSASGNHASNALPRDIGELSCAAPSLQEQCGTSCYWSEGEGHLDRKGACSGPP